MHKALRSIDSAIVLKNKFSPEQIKILKENQILDKRVQLAMEVMDVYNKYPEEKKMSRYACVAAEMNISVTYVIQLLKY